MKHFIVNPDHNLRMADVDIVFGPLDGTEQIVNLEHDDLAVMAVEAGVFESKGQARKNGLGGPCPTGLWQFGTKKRRFWVWNPNSPSGKVTVEANFDKTRRWFG
tara:strand:+ start:186 stop:497 length:312 start_codon:yes stop_codon:yes gene_type:complete